MEAIDKLRRIVNWADWQNEDFNSKFKSIIQLEKAFDFAVENDFEFLDFESRENYTNEDNKKINTFLKQLIK